MVVKEVEEEVEEAVGKVSQPAKAAAVGVLGALAGLPLIILLPVLLVIFGLGIYLVITLTPFIVAGAVFILAFFVARWIKLKDPWNILVPVGAGLIAILPTFVGSFSSSLASVSSAMSGETIPSYSLTPSAFVAIVAFIVLIATGAYSRWKTDNWRVMCISLVVVLLMLPAMPTLVGASAGSGLVAIDGQPAPASFDPLILVLIIGIGSAWAAHRRMKR
jgi:hypothetical protein